MARLTPQQVTEKHARRLKGSIQDIQDGVNAVTQAPGVKAAAKKDKMLANLTAAVQSGKWGDRVSKVTLEDWKTSMIQKGLGRIAQGVDGSQQKIADFYAQLLPFQDSVKAKINAMPDLTLEDNLNRMVANAREMAKFRRK